MPELWRAFLRSEQIAHPMPKMRNGLSGRAAAARGPSCGRIKPPGEKSIRFRTAAVADDEEPPAGAETMLVSLDEADAGEDRVAGVADDDVEIEAGDEALLEEEEEDADDVGILLVGEIGDEEER